MGQFEFFPTPYPDEILYSIICRYHIRSGNPGANTTIKEVWGRRGTAKGLYLSNGLDAIVERLPDETGITADKLIWNHTMFPYVCPTLTKPRADNIYSMLCGIQKDFTRVYTKAGIVGRKPALPLYLRFCPACVKADHKDYGEAFWHRIHQLPGVCICPIHKEYIYDSSFLVHLTFRYFFPATTELCDAIPETKSFSTGMKAHHITFAEDSAWILENGMTIGNVEYLFEKHFRLLVFKGYRGYSPKEAITDYRGLSKDIKSFYGEEFLRSLSSYDEDDYSSWIARFTWKSTTGPSTAHHLLMMRFLSGTPQKFIDSSEEFLPFGKPSWPCRNKICEYFLKDCINEIEVGFKGGLHKAIFTCPYCGYSYRRGKATPKEKQYDTQVSIVDFGWLWKQRLKECIWDLKLTVHETAREMGYPDETIRKYAVLMELLPESRMPRVNRRYIPVEKKDRSEETLESHRKRWLRLMESHPNTKRSVLARLDLDNYKWLIKHDYKWFDENAPTPLRKSFDWIARDKVYLAQVKQAVFEMGSKSGRPVWLCYSSISNKAGIGNRIFSMRENLPDTKHYIDSIIETKDEWRKRKIHWAISQLCDIGKSMSYDKIFRLAGLSSETGRRFREYIEEEIKIFQS